MLDILSTCQHKSGCEILVNSQKTSFLKNFLFHTKILGGVKCVCVCMCVCVCVCVYVFQYSVVELMDRGREKVL